MKHLPFAFRQLAAGLAVCLTGFASARAAEVTQSVTLSAGWNAVWLEVEPVDADGRPLPPATVFDNPSVAVVASPKPLAGLSEFFAAEPGSVTSFNQDEWLQWKRSDPAGQNNLAAIEANRPYLVQVQGSQAVVVTLTGKARFFRPTWTPDRYNLVGFGLRDGMTFDAFFRPSGTTHPVDRIFTLNPATGNWERVTGNQTMASGRAYWVFCSGPSQYMGPVSVDFDFATSGTLDFGAALDAVPVGSGTDALQLDLEEIVLTNAGAGAATPELDLIAQEAAAGQLALHVVSPRNDTIGYNRGNQVDSSPGAGASAALGETVPSGRTAVLTLGAKRNWADQLQRTNMYRLHTGAGASFWLPVRADRGSLQASAQSTLASEVTGLWVGEVKFDSATSMVEDGSPLRPAAGSSTMRMILHSDEAGVVRLLSQVTVMRTKSADSALPAEPVLVVDPAKIPFFEGIKERGGKQVGLRIESVAYDMPRLVDGTSQAALLEDPKFVMLTSLTGPLKEALGTDPSLRTAAQRSLITSSGAEIDAAKQAIERLLPSYLLSSATRPPKLTERYAQSVALSGSLGAGQAVSGTVVLDPFHRSNPFRHAFHRDLARGPQVTREFRLVFDPSQEVAGCLRATCTETIRGLVRAELKLAGRVEFSRVSPVASLR